MQRQMSLTDWLSIAVEMLQPGQTATIDHLTNSDGIKWRVTVGRNTDGLHWWYDAEGDDFLSDNVQAIKSLLLELYPPELNEPAPA